ncbi:hypothetical protein HUT18_16370 [Streptomyces sp. NA04227]|uniref:DUF5819 family protein n=1 Tax=Streptomyces sp. NA04227 TaxID=2742136 RepID=UPI00158FACD9|nr:DUF5819 family protein [Streptomyces sp. NA04227]QKW07722.1 hypothetical protein HUT18_16370 [Streptomyces sp. NA04227]
MDADDRNIGGPAPGRPGPDEWRVRGAHDSAYADAPSSAMSPPRPPGIAGLSMRYQIVAALALAAVVVVAGVHVLMVFLHVSPPNTMTKEHGQAVDEWVYPEFEQNWKLFAPNPLQQNISVQARAQVRRDDGGIATTRWYDLSAMDGAAIDGNLLPSHTEQNELRRAWDFYVASHDNRNQPTGTRGELSEQYIRRIALLRLDREQAGGPGCAVHRLQLRSRTTQVRPPDWSDEKAVAKPLVRELPWWSVSPQDVPLGGADDAKPGRCDPAPALEAEQR